MKYLRLITPVSLSLTLLTATIVGLAVSLFIVVPAQAQTKTTVPKSYGQVKGMYGNYLAFEAGDGTIRIIGTRDGDTIATIVRN